MYDWSVINLFKCRNSTLPIRVITVQIIIMHYTEFAQIFSFIFSAGFLQFFFVQFQWTLSQIASTRKKLEQKWCRNITNNYRFPLRCDIRFEYMATRGCCSAYFWVSATPNFVFTNEYSSNCHQSLELYVTT